MANCIHCHRPQTAAPVICPECYRELTERTETMTDEDKRTILHNQIALLERENADLRAQLENKEYTIMGIMHAVDKWLDGDELKSDEVNRASTMREKTLQIVERLDAQLTEKDKRLGLAEGRLNKAFSIANNAIYLADNSGYRPALVDCGVALFPEVDEYDVGIVLVDERM